MKEQTEKTNSKRGRKLGQTSLTFLPLTTLVQALPKKAVIMVGTKWAANLGLLHPSFPQAESEPYGTVLRAVLPPKNKSTSRADKSTEVEKTKDETSEEGNTNPILAVNDPENF